MVSASAIDQRSVASASGGGESRSAALARELVDAVGVEGAIRYCRSIGWRGVLDEVEVLQRRQALAEQGA